LGKKLILHTCFVCGRIVEKAPAKAAPARGAAAVVVEGEARSMLSLEKTGTIHHLRESPFLDRVALQSRSGGGGAAGPARRRSTTTQTDILASRGSLDHEFSLAGEEPVDFEGSGSEDDSSLDSDDLRARSVLKVPHSNSGTGDDVVMSLRCVCCLRSPLGCGNWIKPTPKETQAQSNAARERPLN